MTVATQQSGSAEYLARFLEDGARRLAEADASLQELEDWRAAELRRADDAGQHCTREHAKCLFLHPCWSFCLPEAPW